MRLLHTSCDLPSSSVYSVEGARSNPMKACMDFKIYGERSMDTRSATSDHHNHRQMASHPPPYASLNRLAWSATVHCFTGCAIGEVLGLALATAFGWSALASIVAAVVLAFIFGYGFTLIPLLNSGMTCGAAVSLALAADTVSIIVMEVVDNAIMVVIPGAMAAGLTDSLFWGSLSVSLIVAFVAAYPVNRWLIARGRGHAVVHTHHSDH